MNPIPPFSTPQETEPMRATIGNRLVSLSVGDISQECADAIVNAANRSLIGGSGVDGAIHRAAGAGVMRETKTRYPQGCPVGSAVISQAGFLHAQYIIHAVGPLWRGGDYQEAELLRSAYLKSLELAAEHSCMSVAFPAIATGAYGYPVSQAAEIALTAVRDFEHASELPTEIHFVLFSNEVCQVFEGALRKIQGYAVEVR
jgi:O-acetyl-ADP-ribose deacetylase